MAAQTEIKSIRPKISFFLSVVDRNEFHAICELEGTKMTYELIKFVKNYVHERRDKLKLMRSTLTD